ncbi:MULTISPECIES: siroheme decarboxylase subunit alpha [Kyrpidia]|uniref:Lrp/AsnC family transcriptional regulator n=2 Tax=Kyrpidia spormannii TaxID=2055160 RepID=A0ACA8Z6W5_9BACL|nr:MULTISPECIES: AsnC family transcriptional regulator [Kyrpidia]MCL6575609.1 AsnC family transcriptional regulator [Kyrpidia sp.]CAB3390973.1 Lrp/AsnC family transcriptional regulator [Kyrpidia spormannii]CAB3391881.1 Lrp/AsnC family transcriptional regulator [Kyrpidia spormannii]
MAKFEMDDIDRELLNLIQSSFPLDPEPFRVVGERCGVSQEEALERIQRLKGKVIRQISAIFDTRSLGYRSSLVAARVNPTRLEDAARVFNEHPGVSHNYRRNHEFNLWFTIAVPPDSRIGLERTVQLLGELAGVDSIRMLPTLRLYKIGVQLDVTGKQNVTRKATEAAYSDRDREIPKGQPLTEADKGLIRELQKDIPLVVRPFDPAAKALGIETEALLAGAQSLLDRKLMRRFSAVLHHREAGFRANAMGVWAVPEDRADEVGAKMASYAAVSHCYLRPTYEDWPYNIFTMVHGRTVKECEAVLGAIAGETGIREMRALYSTKEYKKTRVQYFTPEMEAWEEKYLPRVGLGA